MTEQEQIEEMAKFMHYITRKKNKDCEKTKCEQCWCSCKDDAERLYNAGYRIKPKKAITIPTEERDEEVKETNKILSERDELKAEIAELKSKIEELKLKCAALQMRNEVGQGISDVANNLIKKMIKVEKKKAVQEFAKKLKKKSFDKNPFAFNDLVDSTYVVLVADIDELLKE